MRADRSFVSPPRDVSVAAADNGAKPLVILTCVDGALRESTSGSCAAAREALADVLRHGVPVVLTSHHSAAELIALQRELGLVAPFIAESGRALHVPRDGGGWDVFEFRPASIEDAVELLVALSRPVGDVPLLVGIGASWSDHLLLKHVDVPVVVRSAVVDQRDLQRQFPHAYVTTAAGPAGWTEAILGAA